MGTDEAKSPAIEAGLSEWVVEDLAKSGLTLENFKVEPIESEAQIKSRLGFTALKNKVGEEVKIIDVSGYWIPYPGIPDFYRLKLRYPIETENGTVKYLSPKDAGNHAYILPGVEELLINYNPDKPVFITEGEKKAVKATLEGFPCIGLAGVWCFKESDNLFLPELEQFCWKHRKTYIVFDSDIHQKTQVKHAELRLAVEIINKGGIPYSVRLPNEQDGRKNGLDDYLVRYGAEEFRKLVEAARPTFEVAVSEGTPRGLLLETLVFLKNSTEREKVLKLIAKREGVKVGCIQDEFYRLLQSKKQEKKEENRPEYTEEEKKQAEELLNSQDILTRMVRFTEQMGYVGEEKNKKLVFLACVSRKLPGKGKAISLIAKGESGSGKSGLVKTILKLIPPEDVREFTYVTEKALLHINFDLSHKILCIFERTGSEGANYTIRTALSEEILSIILPVKNPLTGDFESKTKTVPAEGLVYIETTTEEHIDIQNASRTFELYTDPSPELTRQVLLAQAQRHSLDEKKLEVECRVWQCLQDLIDPFPVHIPFAQNLAELFPADRVRARRDFPRLLALIEASALLHQKQRNKVEIDGQVFIEASIEDFNVACDIVVPLLSQAYKEISPKEEDLVAIIKEEFGILDELEPKFDRHGFSIKQLKERIKERIGQGDKKARAFRAYSTLKLYIKKLEEKGLLEWNGEKGVKSRYILVSEVPEIPFSQLANTHSESKKANDYNKLEQETLAKLDFSQSLANVQIPGSLAKGEEIGQTLAKTNFSQSKSNDFKELHQKTGDWLKGQATYYRDISNINTQKPLREFEFDIGDGKTKKLTFYQDGSIREQIFEKKLYTTRVINHNCPDYDDLVQKLFAQLEEEKTDPWQGEVKGEQETCLPD